MCVNRYNKYFCRYVRCFPLELCVASVLVLFLGACSPGKQLASSLEDLRDEAFGDSGSVVYGRAGDITIGANELYYANAAYGVSTPAEIEALSESAQRLVIQKLLLRRMAIQKGLDEGYYSTDEAARYLAPRLEKLFEEYYYHKAAGVEAIHAEAEKLKPDDEALKQLLETDPALQGKGLTVEQIRRERDVLVRRIARRRAELARQKAVDELLRNSPPLEIFPEGARN